MIRYRSLKQLNCYIIQAENNITYVKQFGKISFKFYENCFLNMLFSFVLRGNFLQELTWMAI